MHHQPRGQKYGTQKVALVQILGERGASHKHGQSCRFISPFLEKQKTK
jgi:hypothetical protein